LRVAGEYTPPRRRHGAPHQHKTITNRTPITKRIHRARGKRPAPRGGRCTKAEGTWGGWGSPHRRTSENLAVISPVASLAGSNATQSMPGSTPSCARMSANTRGSSTIILSPPSSCHTRTAHSTTQQATITNRTTPHPRHHSTIGIRTRPEHGGNLPFKALEGAHCVSPLHTHTRAPTEEATSGNCSALPRPSPLPVVTKPPHPTPQPCPSPTPTPTLPCTPPTPPC
jgi:hypothetical protein